MNRYIYFLIILLICAYWLFPKSVQSQSPSLDGSCVFCLQAVPKCKPGQKLVPQTCEKCAHCVDAELDPTITAASEIELKCIPHFSNCSCKTVCILTDDPTMIVDCARACLEDEIDTRIPSCELVDGKCINTNESSSGCTKQCGPLCCHEHEECLVADDFENGIADFKCISLGDSSSSGAVGSKCKCPRGMKWTGSKCAKKTDEGFCTLIFDPVCGCDGKTYSNSCFAALEGIKNFVKGECPEVISCMSDDDCPKGMCEDGKEFQKFSCIDNVCRELIFIRDPCSPIPGSSSGIIGEPEKLSKGFSGIWIGMPDEVRVSLCNRENILEGTIEKSEDKGTVISQATLAKKRISTVVDFLQSGEQRVDLRLVGTRKLLVGLEDGSLVKAKKANALRGCNSDDCPTVCGPFCCMENEECSSLSCSEEDDSCNPVFLGCNELVSTNCCSAETRISTNGEDKRISQIEVGDFVLSDDKEVVKVKKVKQEKSKKQQILRVKLSDATVLEVSPNHPTADGRKFKDLKMGDEVDGKLVVESKMVSYKYKYTYDILPDSKTGNYYANGTLIGSTLKKL